MLELLLAAQLVVTSPPPRERVDQALLIGSISASSIALGLTMACTTDGRCVEVNPVMRRWLGQGETKAVVAKVAIGAATHYAAWRLTHGRPKIRTVTLAVLAAINIADAVHDVRVVRRLERAR